MCCCQKKFVIFSKIINSNHFFKNKEKELAIEIKKYLKEKYNKENYNTLVFGPWSHGQWASTKTNNSVGNYYFGDSISIKYQEQIEIN